MLLALAVVVAAAAPPDGVDLDDLDTWEARAADALAGPPGCWVLEGEIAMAHTVWGASSVLRRARADATRFTGTFTGRIEDGRWTRFEYTLRRDSGDGRDIERPVWPIVGRIDPNLPVQRDADPDEKREPAASVSVGNDGDQALNLLHRSIEAIDPATSTAIAEWHEDPAGVRLIQDVPMSDAARAETLAVATFFPEGGPRATAVDAAFPRKLRVRNGLFRASIYDAQMHLRGYVHGDVVLPARESLSAGVGALGFTVGLEQELVYRRATPCG